MAHVVNPYNIDIDDDAVFSAMLSLGKIWIEEDVETEEQGWIYINADDLVDDARYFLEDQKTEWINFSRLGEHLHNEYGGFDVRQIDGTGKKYKSLLQFYADYPSHFELRRDTEKQGLIWIRLK